MYNAVTTKAKLIQAAVPVAITTTATGTGIDCARLDAITFVVQFGAITGTTPTYDAKVQESPDNSTGWTDIAGAVLPQKTASAASTVLPGLTVKPAQRYVRLVETIAGTTPSFTRAVLALGASDTLPANTGEVFAESTALV